MVVACTVIGALAQLLIKTGANTLPARLAMDLPSVMAVATNPYVFLGYTLYGINMVLLVIALRYAELSILYPIIALTYVWVSLLSVFVLHEHMNALRVSGIALIVLGVFAIGRESR